MKNKVILILTDGMRPDSMEACGSEFAKEFIRSKDNVCFLNARTVYPPVTLPAHMSLSHSVPPERHGVTTNTYTPPVRPVKSLFEKLHDYDRHCAFLYSWEELRDLARPGVLDYQQCIAFAADNRCDIKNTEAALQYLGDKKPDFLFLYLGMVDEAGHDSGWMSEEYLKWLRDSWQCIERVYREYKDEYSFVITADHGGHGRDHGDDVPEDMLIPVLLSTDAMIDINRQHVSILDLAPTIADIMGVEPDKKWEGSSLVCR